MANLFHSKRVGRMNRPLGDLSILIVEDEVIIGLALINEIARAGGTSIGPVTSVADAVKEIESKSVDVVILDAKLVDGWGADFATYLEGRRIPFVVVSGYDKATLPQILRKAPFIAKPISLPFLMEAIESLAATSEAHVAASGGSSSGPRLCENAGRCCWDATMESKT
jgi:two-component SAPR family response regulator